MTSSTNSLSGTLNKCSIMNIASTLFIYLFRFVNTVKNSQLDKKVLWSHLITLRLENQRIHNLECKYGIPKKVLISNMEKLSQMVGFNSTEDLATNLSKSDINDNAKMFGILISCPSFYERLYEKAIYGPKFWIAMLASNIVKKSQDDFNLDALKIFAKISSFLGFKHISNTGNESVGLKKNILGIKGETIHNTNTHTELACPNVK